MSPAGGRRSWRAFFKASKQSPLAKVEAQDPPTEPFIEATYPFAPNQRHPLGVFSFESICGRIAHKSLMSIKSGTLSWWLLSLSSRALLPLDSELIKLLVPRTLHPLAPTRAPSHCTFCQLPSPLGSVRDSERAKPPPIRHNQSAKPIYSAHNRAGGHDSCELRGPHTRAFPDFHSIPNA